MMIKIIRNCRPVQFILLMIALSGLLYLSNVTMLVKKLTSNYVSSLIYSTTKFIVDTPVCKIPDMDPFDDEVKYLITKLKPIDCKQKALLLSNDTHLIVSKDAFPYYKINNSDEISCKYTILERMEPGHDQLDHMIRFSRWPYAFNSDIRINDEYISVRCENKLKKQLIYKDYYSFVPAKTDVKEDYKNHLNVMLVGLDSVSRMNFYRQMPKTVKYLKEKLKAVEYFGYNKVGDNTFPNLVPVLTGMNENELINTCWPSMFDRFDDCPFIWKDFKAFDYTTALCEDASFMGLFHYRKMGFRKQPTDHYWSVFSHIAEEDIGHVIDTQAKLCIGARPVYKSLLEFTLKFVNTYKKRTNFFGLFWESSLTHDDMNRPSEADVPYTIFLKQLKKTKVLNNTILFFLSDHGIRWGDITLTYQGYLEERLPLLFIVVPPWFNKRYSIAYHNLQRNSHLLTTPFDVYQSLQDILNYNFKNKKIKSYGVHPQRGVSLFKEISKYRTCKSAGIAEHWCTCLDDTQNNIIMSFNDETVIKITNYILDQLNNQIDLQYCILHSTYQILDARLRNSLDPETNATIHHYIVTLNTYPGEATFQATVSCINCNSESHYILSDYSISRLNQIGHKAECVSDTKMQLYCICRDSPTRIQWKLLGFS